MRADLYNLLTKDTVRLSPAQLTDGEQYDVYQIVITGLTAGCYVFSIDQNGINTLHPVKTAYFRVLDDADLKDTVKFSYTHDMNEFDTAFVNGDSSRNAFEFRVEGGFLSNSHEENVESEDFRTQRNEQVQLSALPYTVKTLTLGTNTGVPLWVAEKVNHIFSLSEVMVNGVYHVRSGNSIPEQTELMMKNPLFVYKMNVEESFINYSFAYDLYSLDWILDTGRWNMKGIWKAEGIWKTA